MTSQIAYYRPIARIGPDRPDGALPLAGTPAWFDHVEVLYRGAPGKVIAAADLPEPARARLTGVRAPLAGLTLDRARIMGVLNVTPDSFSDGGWYHDPGKAADRAGAILAEGADILDIGGESTRPGAAEVPVEEEMQRTVPLIGAITAAHPAAVISIDTRKAPVGAAALEAGAAMLNDVAAFTFDPGMADLAARAAVPVCLMHAQGDPATMQEDPRYDDVLLDVYDFLADRVAAAEAAGIPRDRVLVDPGIGFGKTVAHNLALIRGLSLFHGLGCAVLLGVSRKRFIGTVSGEETAAKRGPGSVAVALEGLRQGVHVLRVHDIAETCQAVALWRAVHGLDDRWS